MFRKLNKKEVEDFRKWARENFTSDTEINSMFHPVVQFEHLRLQLEHMAENHHAYLLVYDNGLPYENHYSRPVLAFRNEDVAKGWATVLNRSISPSKFSNSPFTDDYYGDFWEETIGAAFHLIYEATAKFIVVDVGYY